MTTLDRLALLLLTSSVWLLMVSVKIGSGVALTVGAILLLAATVLLIVSSLKGTK